MEQYYAGGFMMDQQPPMMYGPPSTYGMMMPGYVPYDPMMTPHSEYPDPLLMMGGMPPASFGPPGYVQPPMPYD